MRHIMLAGALVLGLSACNSDGEVEQADAAAQEYTASRYMQAVNDVARMDDREFDEMRKPGELLAFAQIDKGDVVGDFIMGGGYVTRLLAMAVGANGKVYAFQPEEFIAFRPEYADEQDAAVAPYADAEGNPVNVFPLRGPVAQPGWPEPLDTIITVMNFHDLYLSDFPEGTAQTAIASLYDALKPGGTLVVVDHLAVEGGGVDAANSEHRMDREMAMAALTDAGFVLEEESDLYSRPDDPRTANVFDEGIRGQTDQFAWRLRKPE
ncbi:class I SAM-dependent methyltransferase [Aurantiacibacter poecillastricola]|uniref:class I SAM-dependent methyltransferase n=1 Tax=Aurantiacibacter poecillastricola TaxID=3064385 RepID=UPI00273F83AA|nr:methyltransferase [Aurantiacibacter sp. 219JJ12-13]MDP5260205.1 methyltransferase [Aurantiacibacter sp. 219JJ12-13]